MERLLPASKEDWPCNTPVGDKEAERLPPRLVGALYVLMRDHVQPGDLEQVMLQVRDTTGPTVYTNDHLLGYARALAKHLTFWPQQPEPGPDRISYH